MKNSFLIVIYYIF